MDTISGIGGTGEIAKHGNARLRTYVCLMAWETLPRNPFFKAYDNRKRSEGLPYRKAIPSPRISHSL